MMTRHCHKCGWDYPLDGLPGRSECCHQCDADFRVCLNCLHHDPRAAHQCRESRAEPVAEKASANFCEYFDFIRREWQGAKTNPRESDAREKLRKLFGD